MTPATTTTTTIAFALFFGSLCFVYASESIKYLSSSSAITNDRCVIHPKSDSLHVDLFTSSESSSSSSSAIHMRIENEHMMDERKFYVERTITKKRSEGYSTVLYQEITIFPRDSVNLDLYSDVYEERIAFLTWPDHERCPDEWVWKGAEGTMKVSRKP